jgi:antibiotic biosynthesis monooxygenase (ABM) superfamily enzyme
VNAAAVSTPVTVLVTRRVRHGRAAEFERLMAGMQTAAAGFLGHMGGFLIPPERGEEGCYRVLFAFDTQEHLDAWTNSRERQRWLRRIAGVTHGEAATRVLSGLETWFALPAARTNAPPPRWKMAVVTWIGIFPLVLLASRFVAPLLGIYVPAVGSTLIVTGLIVIAMTWLVMPMLARLFAGWLYPRRAERETDLPQERP